MGDTRLVANYNNSELNQFGSDGSQMRPRNAVSSQREKSNPFLVASTPLLTLMTQVQSCEKAPDVNRLHAQIVNEVKLFVTKLRQLEFQPIMVDCATYCLCAALDEAILATSWGTQSIWVQSSLLSIFKGETWGGERFYVIADTLAREPRKNIYVLELIYTLLSLGFEGQYFGKSRMMRDEIRNRLFQKIRQSRGKIEKSLSLHWQDKHAFTQSLHKRTLLKRISLISVGLIFCVGFYYNMSAYEALKPVMESFNKVSMESPITAYSLLLDRSIFPEKYH